MYWQSVDALEIEKAKAQRRFAMQEKAREKQEMGLKCREAPVWFSAAVDLSFFIVAAGA